MKWAIECEAGNHSAHASQESPGCVTEGLLHPVLRQTDPEHAPWPTAPALDFSTSHTYHLHLYTQPQTDLHGTTKNQDKEAI